MWQDEHIPLVQEEVSVTAALKEIGDKGKGIVGVVAKNGALKGVITDGDIRRFFTAHKTSHGKKAKDAMTRKPKAVGESTSLLDALTLMESHRITNLFVLGAKRQPIGLIHIPRYFTRFVIMT